MLQRRLDIRGIQAARMLTLLTLLSRRAYTFLELADRAGVSERTTRRDVEVLERMGFIVSSAPLDDAEPHGQKLISIQVTRDLARLFPLPAER